MLVSKDVAEILGHNEPNKAIVRHVDEDDRTKYPITDNLGREGKLRIIPTLISANLQSQNYFIPSTYRSGTREYKYYLISFILYYLNTTIISYAMLHFQFRLLLLYQFQHLFYISILTI